MTTELTLTVDLTVNELYTALDALRDALYQAKKEDGPHAAQIIADLRRTRDKFADRLKVL